MERKDLVEQTGLAFDFIQKLYLEVSYLIKEVEGLLAEEDERFVIGRPGGYGITTRSSAGLEPNYVALWPLRKLAVFFVPEAKTQRVGGQTITRFQDNRVIYLRIVLDDKDQSEPMLFHGVLYDFVKKNPPDKWPRKFEDLMGGLEYNEARVFRTPERIDYEDANIKFNGRLLKTPLFDITDSERIMAKIIRPTLDLFRSLA